MRLNSLKVENFRAIEKLEISGLPDVVVLAGPNGCGKSCVLDAVRMLKSAYGSYHHDEWQSWFSEFQIDLKQGSPRIQDLFRDPKKSIRIAATFMLSDHERDFLRKNSERLLAELAWRDGNPQSRPPMMGVTNGSLALTANQRANRQAVQSRAKGDYAKFNQEIESPEFLASVHITPDSQVIRSDSVVLELIFSVYEPQELGVIDYHSAFRTYTREQVANVNLSVAPSDRSRQFALYNASNKYQQLKSEIASAYIRHMLASKVDSTLEADDQLTTTFKELFATFFPGKHFLGPQPTPDGRLLFPVKLDGGGEHDIDELSAGEKEVLYGYLRLRASSPRNSVIMIDEPELHLNPRLVSGLAAFYHKHIGKPLGNQLWLVTHSDTIIREAVDGGASFKVFHIHSAGAGTPESQATQVAGVEDLERLIIELIGDLAAYRPGAKLVIFESTEEAAFDSRMTCALFPDFEQRVNTISVGNKRQVANLQNMLEKAMQASAGGAGRTRPVKVYSITDADDELADLEVAKKSKSSSTRLKWDVYHIENYLVESRFVYKALSTLLLGSQLLSEGAVDDALRSCAEETMHALVGHRLRLYANHHLLECCALDWDKNRRDGATAVAEVLVKCKTEIERKMAGALSAEQVLDVETRSQTEFSAALTNGAWKKRFRGRDVLKRFAGKYCRGVSYDVFRNTIVSLMKQEGFQPPGMKAVIESILND